MLTKKDLFKIGLVVFVCNTIARWPVKQGSRLETWMTEMDGRSKKRTAERQSRHHHTRLATEEMRNR